tara:strand:- start:1545 stop:1943 length:399 start_codon:yes stop_codon:yes gene_type:complete
MFKNKLVKVENLNNDKAEKQVLFNRALDEYKTYNFKNGVRDIDYSKIPTFDLYDKYSLKTTDDRIFNNSTKSLVNEFYKMKEQLVYKDGVGLNRFYKLHKDPQANVIEKYNGDCIPRIGLNTSQIYKDLCNY